MDPPQHGSTRTPSFLGREEADPRGRGPTSEGHPMEGATWLYQLNGFHVFDFASYLTSVSCFCVIVAWFCFEKETTP